MIHFLILGPTGVGKTRLGMHWAAVRHLRFVDLDQELAAVYQAPQLANALIQWGLPLFYQRSLTLLQRLEASTESLLIAVGAGTQAAAQGKLDLLAWPHLFLSAQADWLWQVNRSYRHDPRSFADFCATEFHLWRQQMQTQSQLIVDVTGLSTQDVLAQVLSLT